MAASARINMEVSIHLSDLINNFSIGVDYSQGIKTDKETDEQRWVKIVTLGFLFFDVNFVW